jgi:hypothetical protein
MAIFQTNTPNFQNSNTNLVVKSGLAGAVKELMKSKATQMPATVLQSGTNQNEANNTTLNTLDKGKGKKPTKTPYDFGAEMISLGNQPMKYDNNQTATQLVSQVSKNSGIKPSLLYSSSYIEGFNKAIDKPDKVSMAYYNSSKKGELDDYPIDGFYNYGLDTFGTNYENIKKYLPAGFEKKYKLFTATNEKKQPVQTAAFKTNKDALTAKAAFLKYEQDNVSNYAKSKNLDLDEDAKDYFTMASYNSGFGNAKKMLDEYLNSKDKKSFIEKGETSLKGVHKNIDKRMKLRATADKLLNPTI